MRKNIWQLTIICGLCTITTVIIATQASSPQSDTGVLKAKTFVLVNEKGEPVASIEPLGQGLPGFGIAFGNEVHNATVSFMCTPDGSVMTTLDGNSKSKASLFLGADGSSCLNLGRLNNEMSASVGIGLSGPYMRLLNKDNTYLEADTENAVRIGNTKKTAKPASKE